MCFSFGGLAQRVADIVTRRSPSFLDNRLLREGSVVAGVILASSGVLLNSRIILEYFSMGQISTHWIYVLTGSLFVICGTVLAAFGVTLGLFGHLPSALRTGTK